MYGICPYYLYTTLYVYIYCYLGVVVVIVNTHAPALMLCIRQLVFVSNKNSDT